MATAMMKITILDVSGMAGTVARKTSRKHIAKIANASAKIPIS